MAKLTYPGLAGFKDPNAVVAFLSGEGDLDEKDRLLATLATMVHGREHQRLASSICLLGLWPWLTRIYRWSAKSLRGNPDELVSLIAETFLDRLERLELKAGGRHVATLMLNVKKALFTSAKRAWKQQAHSRAELDIDDAELSVDPAVRTAEESLLGLFPRESVPNDIDALRLRLRSIAGADTDLIMAIFILEEPRPDVAERLGLSPEATRKRVERALERIRHRLEKWLVPS